MLEKLLLAGTITFSLNLFIGMSVQAPSQPTVTAQATTARSTAAQSTATQPTHQSVYLAKALHDSPLLRNLFQ
ncbi:MAG: hypothetical protein KME45_10530 [Stenomitos rutilans HA7619-LM2]|jgi:hypothetical protein|nr:hypothetical protein [Stenomitos rutilans HA7619-LM2]